jgi:hypothetical protein
MRAPRIGVPRRPGKRSTNVPRRWSAMTSEAYRRQQRSLRHGLCVCSSNRTRRYAGTVGRSRRFSIRSESGCTDYRLHVPCVWEGDFDAARLLGRSQAEKTHFHLINTRTGHRLRQQMVDEQTGRVVDAEHKGRGYELSKGHYVPIDEGELKAAAAVPN